MKPGKTIGYIDIKMFPDLVYRNGGGAFLIPYTIMLLCCGLPMMFMELALGQYSSEGPLTVWKLSPIFKGIGIGMVTCSTILVIYYNLITAWGLYYLYLSISSTLPWSCCDDRQWSDERCVSFADCGAVANNQHLNTSTKQSAADQFFHRNVLRISDGQYYFVFVFSNYYYLFQDSVN
jgi:solute carrier family 6 amino acid transporter-like protein 5/7/9/14